MIRDLEELRLSILDSRSKEYIEEAIKCYSAGAYRAAVVLAVAASMDDLRRKLSQLAGQGAATTAVKKASTDVDKLFNDQKAFESTLIDRSGSAAGFYGPSEIKKLQLLLKTRHLCAHPSGHPSSAEEARATIADLVDLVLSRPALMGMAGVSSIIERLDNPVFFSKVSHKVIVATVEEELASLHPSCLPALASKCIESLRREAREGKSPPAELRRNLRRFLLGLVLCKGQAREEVWKRIGGLVEDRLAGKDALWLLARDPGGIDLCDELTRGRALALVRHNLMSKNALDASRGWRSKGVLADDEFDGLLLAVRARLVEEPEDLEATKEQALRLKWDEVTDSYVEAVLHRANSSQFKTAQAAINVVISMSEDEANVFSSDQRLRFAMIVADQAGSNLFRAQSLCRAGLDARTDFLEEVTQVVKDRPEELLQMRTDWAKLAEMLIVSGREKTVERLIARFAKVPLESNHGWLMLASLSKSHIKKIAGKARKALDTLKKQQDTIEEDSLE